MADVAASTKLLSELKSLHPMMIDLSLDRIKILLDALGRPQDQLPPVIHVAGTNGKGSTTAFMSAMLRSAGLRVHVYTSPHLVRFHERIALAGPDGATHPIGENELVALLNRVSAVNAGDPMTFFEITTAAALVAFAETPADVVILEVGLGGRLDATNVVDAPALTVITPVAMDHTDKLGRTLSEIAGEKAGILKPHVPGIIAPQHEDALLAIQRTADRICAPLTLFGQDYDAYLQNGRLVYQDAERLLDLPVPVLRGPHQRVNAAVAVAAVRALSGYGRPELLVDETALAQGLTSATWPARMMPVTSGPLRADIGRDDELWIDSGHNPAAGRAIAEAIADLEDTSPKPTFLVLGMMANKDASGFVSAFKGLVRGILTVQAESAGDGAASAEELCDIADTVGIPATASASLPQALRDLDRTHPDRKRILICGSIYLAGDALAFQGAPA
ncbi:MAG: folylpolyglutamate synthase/dihydrofolate synthase family protein [Pseudomonadota bacterium]